jgi:hypothetical protein
VTLVSEGVQGPPQAVSREEVAAHESTTSIEAEDGMTVRTLVGLLGVLPEALESIHVTGDEEDVMSGSDAINGVVVSGATYYPVFKAVGTGGGEALAFLSPPQVAGESFKDREAPTTSTVQHPLYVTLDVRGGALLVSPPTFSPATPASGKPVSFSRPGVRYGLGQGVAHLRYSWQFGDGDSSNAAEPTHSFEAAEPHLYTVEVVVTGTVSGKGIRAVVTGHQLVSVPVSVTGQGKPGDGTGGGGQGGSPGGPSAGGGAAPGSSDGSPSGAASTPAGHSQPSTKAKTVSRPITSSGAGSGGSGQGSGVRAGDGSAGSPADASAGANRTQSRRRTDELPPARRHAGAAPGLVGVLLESRGGQLPAATLASDASPSESQAASLGAGAASSGGDGGTVGLLGWVAGILVFLIVVAVGGLAELKPGSEHRRLAAE